MRRRRKHYAYDERTNYDRYLESYKLAKSENRLKRGASKLTKEKYDSIYEEVRQNYAKEGIDATPWEIRRAVINQQAFSRETAIKAFKEYKKSIYDPYMKHDKGMEWFRFEDDDDDTYWGKTITEKNKDNPEDRIGRHTTLSGFMGDKHAIHMMIANEILRGRDREEVLADYGY